MVPEYEALVKKLSVYASFIKERYKKQLSCKEGCSSCCILSTVCAVEASCLTEAVNRLSDKLKKVLAANLRKNSGGRCKLLVNNRCVVYKYRPVICRTHGDPLLYNGKIIGCGKSFKEGFPDQDKRLLLELDDINRALSAIDIKYSGVGKKLGYSGRIKISSVIRVALREAQ